MIAPVQEKAGERLGAGAPVSSPAWISAPSPRGFEVFGGRLGTVARSFT